MSQTVHPFTPEADRLVTELRILNMGTTEIARIVTAVWGVARSPATINMRLKSLAALEEAALDAAPHIPDISRKRSIQA